MSSQTYPGTIGIKELMAPFDDWAVVKWTDDSNAVFVFAEHTKGCSEPTDHGPHWSWEHEDHELCCWKCKAPCPEGARALVILYNFNDMGE